MSVLTTIRITVNGQPRSVAADSSVASLLGELDLQPIRVAVEINEDLVPRKQFGDTTLHDGDRVEIVTFVGGG